MQLFLDSDGVLADFDSGAAAVLGMDRRRFELLYGRCRYLDALASAPDFYANLALLPDAMRLFQSVRQLNPIILTAAPGGWAEDQKLRWAERHFPGTPVIITSVFLKQEHCRPGDVLVDDNERHRLPWEAAGGEFVHHTRVSLTLTILEDYFPDIGANDRNGAR